MKYRDKKRMSSTNRASTSAAAHRVKKARKRSQIKSRKNRAAYDKSITLDAIDQLDVKRKDIELWQKPDRSTKDSLDLQIIERARTQWQFGDWESLAAIEKKDIEKHPDGALLALFAAAGKAQQGDLETSGELMRLAEKWGCNRGRVLQIMMAGVYNSLGRAALTTGQKERAHKHFEESVSISGITGDAKLITKARESEQLGQLGITHVWQQIRIDFPLIGTHSARTTGSDISVFYNSRIGSNSLSGVNQLEDIGRFISSFEKCRQFLDTSILGDLDVIEDEGVREISKKTDKRPEQILTDLITLKDNKIALQPPMYFLSSHDLPILIREILLEESYRLPKTTTNPVIVDGGANFGLATYYFKNRFPNARIIAFEPNPELVSVLRKNLDIQGWSNVEIIPKALMGESGKGMLRVPSEMPMGGTLGKRMNDRDDLVDYQVEFEMLSPYLRESIDLLKLDIEGPEVEVLEECESELKNVKRIFCEFHFGPDLKSERLVRLLNVLNRQRFKYTIEPSGVERRFFKSDPFGRAQSGASLSLYAVRTY